MNIKKACFAFLIIILSSCTQHATPKPVGYPYVEKISADYISHSNDKFSFLLSDAATIIPIDSPNDASDSKWFNIIYPQYKVTISCSYLPITKKTLRNALEDNYRLVYSHTVKATEIKQDLYTNEERNVTGIIYDIKGQVATPIQFYATDSVSNFLRGSLYFADHVNTDSIAPVTEYLKEDIIKLMESLEWK